MRFLLVFLSAVLLNSCSSSIQVFETSSTNINREGDFFVFENDSVKITYTFWKWKGIMSFDVYNKLDVPIYIDWKKSSFIYNTYKMNYWVDEEKGAASAQYYSHYYNGDRLKEGHAISAGVSKTKSRSVRTERRTFIPPASTYRHSKFNLLPSSEYELDVNTSYVLVDRNNNPKRKTRLYTADYNETTSPVVFRNYLTFSLKEDFDDDFIQDHKFYLSKVLEMDYRHFMFRVKNENGDFIKKRPFRKETSFYLYVADDKTVEYKEAQKELKW